MSRPKAPPKKPTAAPFFLPTTAGLRDFDFQAPQPSGEAGAPSKLVQRKMGSLRTASPFLQALSAAKDEAGQLAAFSLLKAQPTSGVDEELRSLGTHWGGSQELLVACAEMLGTVVARRQDWELCQAYLAAFLKLHRDELWDPATPTALADALRQTGQEQSGSWEELESSFNRCLSMVSWLQTSHTLILSPISCHGDIARNFVIRALVEEKTSCYRYGLVAVGTNREKPTLS